MWLSHPDPDDEEILTEAFLIAMLNGRTAVLELLMARGFPVNSARWDMTLLAMAVGNGMVSVVECLVRCGADLDLRGRQPAQSARKLARCRFEDRPNDATRRIIELCGLNPDLVLAERDARPPELPHIHPAVEQMLAFANDDAFRSGQAEVCPENLLFGLLREGGEAARIVTQHSGMDLERFRSAVRDRTRAGEDRVDHPKLPMHPAAEAIFERAIALVTERRHDLVTQFHLLYALMESGSDSVVELLARHGGSAAPVMSLLERSL
jgi:Clp amino terminal domain, pathogenicity island component